MKLVKVQPQLIVRNENLVDNYSIDESYIIYSGLGHIVLDIDKLKNDNITLFNEITSKEDCYFRISYIENPEENMNEYHCYLSKELQYFKAKKLKNGHLCFLGIDFTLITLTKIASSKNFSGVPQFHCIIKNISIDKEGVINEEVLWDKTKYGQIESFLPSNLSKFENIIKSNRKVLTDNKE